jgi:hypothetical protein
VAYDLDDEVRLGAVGALAHEQSRWLKEHAPAPTHGVSVPTAIGSSGRNLWDVMGKEAETRQRLLVQCRYLREPRSQRRP